MSTALVHCSSGGIYGSSFILGSCGLLDLMFLLVGYMWPLGVDMDGGRCLLIRYIVKFVHISKYPLVMACRRVYFTSINSVVWYHCTCSSLVLSTIRLFADWGVGDMFRKIV